MTTLADQIHDATAGTTNAKRNSGIAEMSADLSAETVSHDEKSGMDTSVTTRIVETPSRLLPCSIWGLSG